jgi:K+-transporting ATPase ATPase A chain
MNTLLTVVIPIGRYLPMVFVLALAGAFARQRTRAEPNTGTVQTHTPTFLGLTTGVAILTSLLSFVAALALEPLAAAL